MRPTLERAEYLYRLQRYPAAIEATMEFLGHFPESAAAYCILGLCHAREKRKLKAIEAVQAAIQYQPDWCHPYYIHALIHHWFDDNKSALRSLSEALRINPADADYYELLASIHYEAGTFQTVISCAMDGLAIDPEHVGCLYRLAMAYYELKRRQEAEGVLRNALRIEPEHAGCQGLLGCIENANGQYREALPLLRQALREHPHSNYLQEAWKESLRGSFAAYGVASRWKQQINNFKAWPFFVVLYGGLVALLLLILSGPKGYTIGIILGSFALAIIPFILLIIILDIMLACYLHFVSLFLVWRVQELKQATSFRRWLFADWQRLLFVCLILSVVLYGAFRRLLEK